MVINTLLDNGDLTVKPEGRLDSSTSGELDRVLTENINDELKSLTVDLKDVDFISSKGLRVLVSAYKNMNGRGMALKNVNASIMEVLRLSGLLKVFIIKEEQ